MGGRAEAYCRQVHIPRTVMPSSLGMAGSIRCRQASGCKRARDDELSVPRSAMAQKKSIVFFHPDLGIGGAERLVIDAAVGLQARGHKVTIFTSHCDPGHCFEEARDGN